MEKRARWYGFVEITVFRGENFVNISGETGIFFLKYWALKGK